MEQDAPSTFQQEAIVEKAGELFGWCDEAGTADRPLKI